MRYILNKGINIKKAFTLFELIIVVFLIGIIYAIVLTNFNAQSSVNVQKFENLKNHLATLRKLDEKVDLYIYDACSKSAVFINDTLNEELEVELDIKTFEKVKVFKTDRMAQMQEIQFSPLLIKNKLKDVCFQFTIYPNNSTSSYIVELQGKFYVFYPYFEQTEVVMDKEEAKDLYMHNEYRVSTENM